MAMTKFEKLFVNRQKKGDRNIEIARNRLNGLNIQNIHDVLEIGCGTGTDSILFYFERNSMKKLMLIG